jgi:hypothetical protein
MANADSTADEKRSEQRIAGERLPQQLQTLKVSFGDGGESYRVKTIDASVSGISFRIELPAHAIQDYNLTIATDDGGITLHDELVYAKPLDQSSSRVSVHFSKQPGLEEYTRLVDRTGH